MGLRQIRQHTIEILFPLTVLFVFGASSVLAILLAADIYSGSIAGSRQMYNGATALAYVQEKVHQNDASGAVRVQTMEDLPVLVLERNQGDQTYYTYIYAWEGSLRELFAHRDVEFDPASGRALLAAESFSCQWVDSGLLQIRCTDGDGTESAALIGLLSAEE